MATLAVLQPPPDTHTHSAGLPDSNLSPLTGKKNFLPPSYLMMGFSFLFKVLWLQHVAGVGGGWKCLWGRPFCSVSHFSGRL